MELELSVSSIEPNKFNPNVVPEEQYLALKADVAKGDYDAITVSPQDAFYEDPELPQDRYVLVDGEHRWMAAVEAGLKTINSNILPLTESEARSFNYRRNKERGNMDPIKEAALFELELQTGLTEAKVAAKYNVTRSYVASRRSLLRLDPAVIELYKTPEQEFKRRKEQEYEERLARWQGKMDQATDESHREVLEEWKPEFDEKGSVPRVTLTASHLEVISSLPADNQVEVADDVLSGGMSVRRTEEEVRRVKARLEEQHRLQEAVFTAKRKKCPKCGGEPSGFSHYYDGTTKLRCGECGHAWEHMKTRKEAEAGQEAEKIEEDKQRAELRRAARENPRFIRRPETPEELHDMVHPWVLRKILQLTEIKEIRIKGKRGDEDVDIDYGPPKQYSRMNLHFHSRAPESWRSFGFIVEAKDYKKFDAKSRVDLMIDVNEENRQNLHRFFDKVVETGEDPWEET